MSIRSVMKGQMAPDPSPERQVVAIETSEMLEPRRGALWYDQIDVQDLAGKRLPHDEANAIMRQFVERQPLWPSRRMVLIMLLLGRSGNLPKSFGDIFVWLIRFANFPTTEAQLRADLRALASEGLVARAHDAAESDRRGPKPACWGLSALGFEYLVSFGRQAEAREKLITDKVVTLAAVRAREMTTS